MSTYRIQAENLGKSLGGRWVLRRLDLQLKEGEALGIIGANGAGKSTLLKTLSGLLHPDEGNYQIRGRMASLLEVGTGFHPDLSGRENAYLRGALLGISRAEIDEIVTVAAEFAGLSDRLDEPIKYYSSGMQVRLGFALSAHLPADIMLVDEVLAVGDIGFQSKSLALMESMWKSKGRSIIFVAHQLHTVRKICDRVLWLEHGMLRMEGQADEVCDAYIRHSISNAVVWPHESDRRGEGGIRASNVELHGNWSTGSPASITVGWTGSAAGIVDVRLGVLRTDGTPITLWSSRQSGSLKDAVAGSASLTLPKLALSTGTYSLQLRLFVNDVLHDEIPEATLVHVVQGAWNGQPYPTPRTMALQDQEWS